MATDFIFYPELPNRLPQNTRVVVAMSGGVDSSVVACLLKQKNYDVVGITLKLYEPNQLRKSNSKSCCGSLDIEDAKKVAAQFDFPHYVLDYQTSFKQAVVDDFADSYLRGETPIPCVRCNQSVKFHDLLAFAKSLKADALVTGHYVRKALCGGKSELHKALDPKKDQSYFLFATTLEQLDFIHFPLGGNTKEQTRALAAELGLMVADKPDSQDICFVPNGDYASVIRHLRPTSFKPGEIIDIESKKVLGRHDGIINFTIGQRRGIGVSSSEPLYVVKIDPKENQVLVGPERFLQNTDFVIKDLNWLADEIDLTSKIEAKVRLRSSQQEDDASIKVDATKTSAIVTMRNPTRAVTAGQACVIYQDTRVLGGGWIASVL